MKKLIIIGTLIPILYVFSYIGFRYANVETWDKNGKNYVIFPQRFIALYYFYRPMSYIDAKVTGIGIHIGAHQE